MVGYCYSLIEPTWEHLSPACPRLAHLVDNGGVATQEDCRNIVVTLYPHFRHSWSRAVELKCKTVVPVEIVLLPLLNPHANLVVDIRATFVDDKGECFLFSLPRGTLLYEEPSVLSPQHRAGSTFFRTYHNGHPIVAVGYLYREEQGSRNTLLELLFRGSLGHIPSVACLVVIYGLRLRKIVGLSHCCCHRQQERY